MNILRFPGRLDVFCEKLALASTCPSRWSDVLTAFSEMFPGCHTTITRVIQSRDGVIAIESSKIEAVSVAATERRLGASSKPPLTLVAAPSHAAGTNARPGGGWRVSFDRRRKDDRRHPDRRRMSPGDLRTLGLIGDTDDGSGLVLMRRDPWMWALALSIPVELSGRYTAGAELMLERLGGDIRRAFAISYGLGTLSQPSRETIEESWDRLPVAAALVDLNLITQATNSAADDLFASRRYFLPMSHGRGVTAADVASRDLMIRNVDRVICGESHREAFALDGLRGAPPLPVVVRAIGRLPEWDRFRAISRVPADCAIAFFGTPDVLSAQMPDKVFA